MTTILRENQDELRDLILTINCNLDFILNVKRKTMLRNNDTIFDNENIICVTCAFCGSPIKRGNNFYKHSLEHFVCERCMDITSFNVVEIISFMPKTYQSKFIKR